MKNKFYNLFIFFVLTALAGCNEKESTDVIEQGDPQIIEFTPTDRKSLSKENSCAIYKRQRLVA